MIHLLLVLALSFSGLAFAAEANDASDNERRPRIEATMLDGGPFGLSDASEQLLLLSIWSPDSLASRKSIGELERFDAAHARRGVRTIAVSTSSDAENLRAFLSRRALRVPVAILGTHDLGRLHDDELPRVLLLDRQGRQLAVHRGMYRLRDLEALVAPYLALGVGMSSAAAVQAQPPEPASRPIRANDAVYALYDLMEPLWNAPPGSSRDVEACAMGPEIKNRVRAMAVRPTPENAAMIRSAVTLEEACQTEQLPVIDQEIDRLSVLFYKSRVSRMIYR